MILHPWQERVLRALPALRRPLVQARTGAGKTVIGVAHAAQCTGRRVWIAHRRELINQVIHEARRQGVKGIECVTVQSAGRLAPGPIDHLFVDECHRSLAPTYLALIERADRVIGLSATPRRSDGQGLGKVYETIVEADVPDRPGYIVFGVPVTAWRAIHDGIDADQDREEAGNRTIHLFSQMIDEWRRHAGCPTIAFAATRKHGRQLADRMRAARIRVAYVDGSTPKGERDKVLRRLGKGQLDIVVNVDIWTEGVDLPPLVRCVLLARPTRSLRVFLQQVGRVRHPEPIILDCVGNTHEHGMPDTQHTWSLEDGKGATKGTSRVSAIRYCGAVVNGVVCGAVNSPDAEECVVCGAALYTVLLQEHEEVALERMLSHRETLLRWAIDHQLSEAETRALLDKAGLPDEGDGDDETPV